MNNTLSDQELSKVQDILIEELDIARDQITPEARIVDDLGADSLAVVNIGMTIEERFDILIPEKLWDQVETVADLCETVADLLAEMEVRACADTPSRGGTR